MIVFLTGVCYTISYAPLINFRSETKWALQSFCKVRISIPFDLYRKSFGRRAAEIIVDETKLIRARD